MQVKEVFAVTGGAQGLVRLLGSSSDMDLLVETAWVICHATHTQAHANRLLHLGLIQPALQQVQACTLQVCNLPDCHALTAVTTIMSENIGNQHPSSYRATADGQCCML